MTVANAMGRKERADSARIERIMATARAEKAFSKIGDRTGERNSIGKRDPAARRAPNRENFYCPRMHRDSSTEASTAR